ncbi:MAG TPA: class I SAM-dependent methyltransferase, partial [Blastocatellia bacterium]|nr:class I SAM-dependent methyltransferase [Blastocatellia bacterium]
MDSRSLSKSYDAYYYAHGCGEPYQRSEKWLRFFRSVAERVVTGFQPSTVLDAGCAMGFLVEALRDKGIFAYGIDLSEYAISQVREDIRPFCRTGSLTEPLPQSYDLIVCIEVLEHLSADEGQQ